MVCLILYIIISVGVDNSYINSNRILDSSLSSKRKNEWDIVKVFAIFLVLEGHSIMHLRSGDYWQNPAYLWICSFHMPLFMIVTGYFSYNALRIDSIYKFVKHKVVQLLLPIVSWSILFAVSEFFLSGTQHLKKDLIYTFWFLRSAFACYVIFYLCLRIFKKNFITGLTITIFITFFIKSFNLDLMYPCFVFGYFLNRKFEFYNQIKLKVLILSLFLYIFICVFFLNDIHVYNSANPKQMLYPYPNFNNFIVHIGGYFIRLASGISGSMIWISLILLFKDKLTGKFWNNVSYIGRYTLAIYILQTYFLERYMPAIVKFDNFGEWVYTIIICPVLSLLVLIFCFYLGHFINRWKISRLLFLGIEK